LAKRITIMLDDDIDRKIRLMQSKIIKKENKSISFSSVINLLLEENISKKNNQSELGLKRNFLKLYINRIWKN
jgi:hypothetical protein